MLEAERGGVYRLIAIRVLFRMPVFHNDFKCIRQSENLTL